MTDQRDLAAREMAEWLSHPSELGRRPAKLECAGAYVEEGLRYFIFRFKKSLLSPWQLAVCGGFGPEDEESTGHVASDYAPYRPDTAERDCRELVRRVREFKRKKQQALERRPAPEVFRGSVLLRAPGWDTMKFLMDLRAHGLEPTVIHHNVNSDTPSMTVILENITVQAKLLPFPVPPEEAQSAARAALYDREGALEAAGAQTGQVLLTAEPSAVPCKARGAVLLTLAMSLCATQDGLGLLTRSMIVTAQTLDAAIEQLANGEFPVQTLVRVQVREEGSRRSARTDGLRCFGHWELEIPNSAQDAPELARLLLNTAAYIVDGDAVLLPGETLGYTASQRLPITLSPGTFSDEETVKIEY